MTVTPLPAPRRPAVRTLLKREESYAVHALLDIAAHPGTNAAAIAGRLQLPPAFLAKVLRKLVVSGYVGSHMGRSGGVELLVDLDQVSLLDVIEQVSGAVVLDTCQTEVRCATQRRTGHCSLKLAWLSASHEIETLLGSITLGRLRPAADPAPPVSEPPSR